MTKTLIDLDDDLLADATRALGTSTKKDTVTKALQEAVDRARERRRAAHESLLQMADEGVFDWDRLAELDE